jgi:D-alanyl-D-alanine carboxypeptidase
MTVRLSSARLTLLCLLARPLAAQFPSRAELVHRIDSIAAAPVRSGAVAGMAVAVVKGRDTLLLEGYGFADLENQVRATPQTVFRIGSITKQFTSSAVMQLVEQGKIGLDDEVTKYFPNVPTHGRHILVRHLLNHTSGIPSFTDIGPQFGAVSGLDLPHDSVVALVAHDSLLFEPGSHFYYSNTGYYLLGMLLERVTGKPYGEYLAERLFAPNGLSSMVYCDTRRLVPHRAHGYDRAPSGGGFVNTGYISMELPFAAGSLCSTVGDLVTWTDKLANGRVVSAASYAQMTTPVKLPSTRPMTYGFGLTADTLGGHRVIWHTGGINGFISALMYLPQDSLIVAVLANTAPAPSDDVAKAIIRAVLGLPPAAPAAAPKEVALSASELSRYVGTYALTRPDGSKHDVRVAEDHGQLTYQLEGQPSVKMTSLGAGAFLVPRNGRIVVDIVNGRATGFVAGGDGRTLEALRLP